MAQSHCASMLPEINETQPPVLAWGDYRGGCNGNKGTFPGEVDANLLYTNRYGIGANDIDSMWIPPNMIATLSSNGENVAAGVVVSIDGSHTAGADINYPGLYQFDQGVPDIYGRNTRIGLNDVDIVSTRIAKPWSDHLYSCCADAAADVRKCGQYKPGAAVCKSRLLTCTGDKLKTDEGCQNMCRSDPLTCDKIKKQYCDANPNDKWCSCMNVEQNADFIKLQDKIIQKTGQSPRLACSPFGRCMTGTDLVDIYLPKNIIDDRTNTCPSYSSYLDQSITTSGSGNIVNANQSGSAGGGTGNNSAGTGGSSTSTGMGLQDAPISGDNNIVNLDQNLNTDAASKSNIIKGVSNQTILIILGFVMLIFAALWFAKSDTADAQYPGMYQPNMYQPNMYQQQMYYPPM